MQEVVQRLLPLDLAFGQLLHAVHEVVPLGDGNPQLLLDGVGIEAGVMRHPDGMAGAVQRDGQGVVADHPDGGRGDGSGEGAVARGGEQQVAIDDVRALEDGLLAGARQCPELASGLEHAGGFHLVAADLGEIAIELKHRPGLHDLVAAAHDGQGGLGVAAVEDLVVLEGLQGLERRDCLRTFAHVAHRGFSDGPVHAGTAGPDVDRLLGREPVAEQVPGSVAGEGHCFDEMCHRDCLGRRRARRGLCG
ncbi:hypothetical protein D3C87_1284370 [compost metagenome]